VSSPQLQRRFASEQVLPLFGALEGHGDLEDSVRAEAASEPTCSASLWPGAEEQAESVEATATRRVVVKMWDFIGRVLLAEPLPPRCNPL
jgi:hypothetical protein